MKSLVDDYERYMDVYSDVHYQLRHTISNYDCLDVEEVDEIIKSMLDDVELGMKGELYYNGEGIQAFHMFVFEIKKRLLSKLGG